ncbi:glycosyltransferase [Nocardioides sp.]|uniref:glycosyltransferase family 2 protein n=1 Tax=Nocardioides sp. TaxID=35761 RepID=UPI001A321C16|nr:glycosyltransferase [Nocardioides sp.]MBJ7355804.1 glycosyltransferase family 2 protein [Nocardioides sp.]
MFVAFDRRVRVHLGVVALGAHARLRDCLEALVAHESAHDFAVSCLVNPVTPDDAPLDVPLPAGVHVERPGSNLGWPGGLQRLRGLWDGELFVWVQDDMVPVAGWLDALVAAADAHPRVGCFGALRVDEEDRVLLHNGGRAEPPDRVRPWNDTDTTAEQRPTEVTTLDWVTSKGCLTRAAAFDDVSGPDPRLWPLNHVDKDYCTHLRAHGWDVALVPQARLLHLGSQSAPSSFRGFLNEWRDGWFDARWGATATALHGRTSAEVDHPCAEWRDLRVDAVEAAAGQGATRMLVPFARLESSSRKAFEEHHEAVVQAFEARVADLEQGIEEAVGRLHEATERLERSRRRARRLRRRLRQQPQPRPGLAARLGQRLARLR